MSVTVLGSANLDLVYRVERLPGPGETVLASGFESNPGGKGNNQAIAAARAGADTAFVAVVGLDAAAETLIGALGVAGVTCLLRRIEQPTGTALITVDDAAENSIVVNPGANSALLELTADERSAIEAADFLLMQLESPLETVLEAARVASAAGTRVVLNAAPIRDLPDGMLALVDILIVNEHEAAALTGTAGSLRDALGASSAAVVITTLGPAGASIDCGVRRTVKGIPVRAVDTTGAGDTFCGALLAALDEALAGGADPMSLDALEAATRFATAAAALSVTSSGAVPSIPTRQEIDDFQSRQ
jgi:ribokinase